MIMPVGGTAPKTTTAVKQGKWVSELLRGSFPDGGTAWWKKESSQHLPLISPLFMQPEHSAELFTELLLINKINAYRAFHFKTGKTILTAYE